MKELFGRCPYITARRVLVGKWSMYILFLLKDGPMRFNALLNILPKSVSAATLSNLLKVMEDELLIIRTDYSDLLLRVEYSLSSIGKSFSTTIEVMGSWSAIYKQAKQNKNEGDEQNTELSQQDIMDAYLAAQRMLTGKWTMYIMNSLYQTPLRFNELLRRLPDEVTTTTLSKALKMLEDEGMITRTVYEEMPLRVEYAQTKVGHSFKTVLDSMADWSDYYRKLVREQRDGIEDQ